MEGYFLRNEQPGWNISIHIFYVRAQFLHIYV